MKDLTVIDNHTGEVLPVEQEISIGSTQFLALLQDMGLGQIPLLLQDELLNVYVEEDLQSDVADLYNIDAIGFGNVTNQSLPVYGAAIFEFEPGLKKDGSYHERYFQARILVKLDGKLQIVKSSGQPLIRHIARMCKNRGWFIWHAPVEYKFTCKGAGSPHYMERVEREIKHVIPKSQREGQKNV